MDTYHLIVRKIEKIIVTTIFQLKFDKVISPVFDYI